MNPILQLKGDLKQRKSNNGGGASNIPKESFVKIEKLEKLRSDLEEVKKFWLNEKLLNKVLVRAHYKEIVAKSNRIKGIFGKDSEANNKLVVGAKFKVNITEGKEEKKHIITYCITNKILNEAINKIQLIISFLKANSKQEISYNDINEINKKKIGNLFEGKNELSIPKSRFINIIVDAYYLEGFDVQKEVKDFDGNSIITIYDTGTKISEILEKLEIETLNYSIVDNTTVSLTKDQYNKLKNKAPYLISMGVKDLMSIDPVSSLENNDWVVAIPDPTNEPTIGVIDTLFDKRVYFSKWVEFKNMLDKNITTSQKDYEHGTMVSSIIVDGPTINPELDDGCGRFKVRHFGVAPASEFSILSILKSIEEIIVSNRDIKVWNLSLGSKIEIQENYISYIAALLDKIQYENNVIFVVAGTNKELPNVEKIGDPADSINSIVVNSVGFDGKPANYARKGPVLSFFRKPDVSYYGGTRGNYIKVCGPNGEAKIAGTSFAVPWITRKVAYLIEVLGLTRELAKALIIDSAAGWENNLNDHNLIGYGIVPKHINDIIKTDPSEIKFLISGVSEKYDTYSYDIPVPIDSKIKKHPFVSKSTLCYFPKCSRNQGVDYTNTEMDIHFGALVLKNEKTTIKSINENRQSENENLSLKESKARKLFRKWDNVKHIRENKTTAEGRPRQPKDVIKNYSWGISIKTKARQSFLDGKNLAFGVVVTLREIYGKNRIDDFIQQASGRGWFVKKIEIKNKIDIYNKASEEIKFNNDDLNKN
ncbi:S8 family peptidase [Mycoplasmopsis citelli]|uniref:Peptidase S8/S53 domain-containing protein n=1 Tax=Mycoplasmopsis citelli TaxID=171281 RepID=A0A449B368_9BACT|nr:S8 family peptidase [Mycoplasmopsis citelli]UUD36404.1 S8 family peptidase [Mycoplasmopsis citelli]VEU75011.1 Uncharacterised protein [Mycoplasmopsis citelli]